MVDAIAIIGLLSSAVSFGEAIHGFTTSVTRNERTAHVMLLGVQQIHNAVVAMVAMGALTHDSVAPLAAALKDALEKLAADCERRPSWWRRVIQAGKLGELVQDINTLMAQLSTLISLATLAAVSGNEIHNRQAMAEFLRRLDDRLPPLASSHVYVRAGTDTPLLEDHPDELAPDDGLIVRVTQLTSTSAAYLVAQLGCGDDGTRQRWAMEAVRNVLVSPTVSPMELFTMHLRDGSYARMREVPKYRHNASAPHAERSLVNAGAIPWIVKLVRSEMTHWAAMRALRHLSGNRAYHAELVASGAIGAVAWTLRRSGTDAQNAIGVILSMSQADCTNQTQFALGGVLLPLAVRVFHTEYAKAEAVAALRVLAPKSETREMESSHEEQAVRLLLTLVHVGNQPQQAAAVDALCSLASMPCAVPVLKAVGVPLTLHQLLINGSVRCAPTACVVKRALFGLSRR